LHSQIFVPPSSDIPFLRPHVLIKLHPEKNTMGAHRNPL
jgi:hypothetical protein